MTSFQNGPFRVLMMIAFTIASIFCVPQAVQARGILGADNIPAGKTIPGDRFLYGTEVTMDGNVDGDVFAIGQEIVINGNVGGSLVAIGQKVTINSEVGGTLYSTALEFELTPAAKLTRNLYFVGASMNTQTGSLVNRDLYAATLGAQMAGSVNGEVKAVIGPAEFFFLIMNWIEESIPLTSNPPTTTTISTTDIRSLQSVTSVSVVSAGLMDIQPVLMSLERILLQQAGGIDWVSVGNWFLERARE
ncbi:MAG TPA: hypothetical protein VLM80_04665 [Anaerolineales bacterium]|nr:hypothetical protein [Anaerolineales bacterium]